MRLLIRVYSKPFLSYKTCLSVSMIPHLVFEAHGKVQPTAGGGAHRLLGDGVHLAGGLHLL